MTEDNPLARGYIINAIFKLLTRNLSMGVEPEYLLRQESTVSVVGDYEAGEFSSYGIGFRLDLDED